MVGIFLQKNCIIDEWWGPKYDSSSITLSHYVQYHDLLNFTDPELAYRTDQSIVERLTRKTMCVNFQRKKIAATKTSQRLT